MAVFAFGGLFDMVWHQAFGIEVGLEALLSPSHLVLFCGALLVSTSPLRAGWHDPDLHAPTFRRFLPVLLSSTFATAGVAFFFMNFAPWLTGAMTDTPYDYIAANFDGETASWMVEEIHIEGYAAILATTVILVTPVLLLARRWVLPFGTMTFLLGTVGALVASIESFDMGPVFVAAAVGGLGGDVLYRRLRPTPAPPRKMRYVAAGLPLGMWFAYFALLGLTATVGWSIELWSGVSVMSALLGLGLALLAFPPEIPDPRTAADEY